jgi:hypothetical protein
MLEELDVAFLSVPLGVCRETLDGEIIDMIKASKCQPQTLILRRVTITASHIQCVHGFLFHLSAHCTLP